MNPDDIKNMTLDELDNSIVFMSSPDWNAKIAGASSQEKLEAANIRNKIQTARLELENANIHQIVNQLIAHEGELNSAISGLQSARKKLNSIREYLDLLAKILEIIVIILPWLI